MTALKADVHPPLYYQVLYAWIRLVGTGERAVRTLSALFYLCSIFAMYRLSGELFEEKTALLVTAIYVASPLAILSAQFARMYSLLSLLSILSSWFYLKSFKSDHSKATFAIYIVVNALGTLTHIAFFFLLFGQSTYVLLFKRERLKAFVFGFAISLLPYAFFWLPVLLRQVRQTGEGLAWVSGPTLFMIGELLVLYGGASWLLVPILLYVWLRNGRSSPHREVGPVNRLPLWLLGLTILTPLVISVFKPIFNARLAIVGLHLFALTIGSIICKRASYFLVIQLMLITTVAVPILHPGFSNCDNRAVATYLNSTANNGDAIVFTSLTRLPIDFYLYGSGNQKSFFETSFPAEIDNHPGYEGRTTDPNRKPVLEAEGQKLVETLALRDPRGQSKLFFLHGAHPEVDSLFAKHLTKHFQLLSNQGVKCELSPYFRELSVYTRKLSP